MLYAWSTAFLALSISYTATTLADTKERGVGVIADEGKELYVRVGIRQNESLEVSQ